MGSPAAPAPARQAADSDDDFVAPKARSRKILDSDDEDAPGPLAARTREAPVLAAPQAVQVPAAQRPAPAKPKGKAKAKPKAKGRGSDSESSFISSDSES